MGRRLPLITSSRGLTETASTALLHHAPANGASTVGVPLPGVNLKLIDDCTGRIDVRIKGDTVSGQYHQSPAQTRDASDPDGFFITGDAMCFIDPCDMSKGLRFDGRLSEDFKLATGTWVHSGQLRLDMLAELGLLAQDVMIWPAGRDDVGMLIVPGPDAREGEARDCAICADSAHSIRLCIERCATKTTGSAPKVARALVMA